MSVSTQAQVPITQVIAACDAYLADNDARIEREREALIEKYTKPALLRKAKTREEAMYWLERRRPQLFAAIQKETLIPTP